MVETNQKESGQVIVLMVLVVIGLLGAVALAVDGGRVYLERRSAQNAADNAALSAAYALCSEQSASSAATQAALQNGFDAASDSVDIEVHNPPASGPHAGDDDFVAVTIISRPQMAFAQLVYSGEAEASASALAECVKGGGGPVGWGNGIIALNPSTDKAIDNSGSGCMVVNGGGIYVESSNSSAAFIDGGGGGGCPGGARTKGSWVELVGGVALPSWVIPYGNPAEYMSPWPPTSGATAKGDPLLGLLAPPEPSQPAAAASPNIGGCTSSPYSNGNLNLGSGYAWCTSGITIYPGTYKSFSISTDVQVTMQPGLYYISEGNFSLAGPSTNTLNGSSGVSIFVANGNVSIDGSARPTLKAPNSGVLFHLRSGSFSMGGASVVNLSGMNYIGSGSVTIAGSGNLTLAAPTEGAYAGMVFFMGRGNTSNFTVNGGSVISLTGTMYGPDAKVRAEGSGSNNLINGQFIANRYEISGAAKLVVTYDEDVIFQGAGGSSFIQLTQ